MFKGFPAFLKTKTSLILLGTFLAVLIYALTRRTVDFYPFYWITRELLYLNADLYGTHPAFSYPPFFYCVVAPFAVFQAKVAFGLWIAFSVALLFAAIFLVLKMLQSVPSGSPVFLTESWNKAYLGLALVLFIVFDNLYLGQSNILVFFLTVFSIYLFEDGREYLSGITIAAAIAIKITPALFLVYFIFRGGRKVFTGALAGLAAFFFIIPSMFFGVARSNGFFRDFISQVILPFAKNDTIIRETVYYTHTNQSLDAFLVRHFTPMGAEWYPATGVHKFIDPAFFTVGQVKAFSAFFKVFLLSFFAFIFRGAPKKLRRLEYSLVFLLVFYISPSSWLSHYIAVIFAYYTAIFWFSCGTGEANRNTILLGLFSAVILTATGTTPFLQSFSGMFIGHFILFVCLTIVYLREKRISKTVLS